MADNFESSGLSAQPGRRICSLCTTAARYKCPRCATPTCSLPCSRKHKQDTACSGERDKVQYVPMNAYGWGTMMRDYCYLEDVGRKVSDWGNEIVRGGYMDNIGARKAVGARRSSSGRRPTTRKSKRDMLRDHLETLGIDVDFLPAGMERRNLNQSAFDQKSKRFLLTIELVFYPPTTLESVPSSSPSSCKMLSHRNSLSATLLTIFHRQVSLTLSKQKENAPDWLPSMVIPHPEAPEYFTPPHCYIRANTEFPHAPDAAHYHKLEPTLSLGELLQKTFFVEFPTIHVFDPEASSFCGTVVDKSGSIVRALEDDQNNVVRATKQKKLNKAVGLKAVFSLVGGYGSEVSTPSEEEMEEKHLTGLAVLGTYLESADEVAHQNTEVEEEDQSLDSDDNVPPEGDRLDLRPAKLPEFMKQARGGANEDVLDWVDEWDSDVDKQRSNAWN